MELGLCIEMAFSKLPFEQRLEKAAELGFKNVEMWFVDDSFKGKPEKQRQNIRHQNRHPEQAQIIIMAGKTNVKIRDNRCMNKIERIAVIRKKPYCFCQRIGDSEAISNCKQK